MTVNLDESLPPTPAQHALSRTRPVQVPAMMRALQIAEPQQAAIIETMVPAIAEDELLIRVEGCGVCGSNLPLWEGRDWFTYPLPPGNPGHEAWGRIVDMGQAASSTFTVGDRVAMLSYAGFAEYDVAKADATLKLPANIAGQPFPAEPLACAFNVFARTGIQPSHIVAIVGIGFLGALLTALAADAGATVIAITRRPFALELARHYGAEHTLVMDDHWRIIEQVKAITHEEGCDCVIEAVGAQWPLDLASELTKVRGRLVIAGYHQDGPREVNMQQWNWRGIDVINAHERDPKIYVDGMKQAIEAVASGKFDPAPLYTHRFPLEEISQSFALMQQRPDGFLKALIEM
jgi:threonine dehydrogenase-like Zn-dependent dehydrogenase